MKCCTPSPRAASHQIATLADFALISVLPEILDAENAVDPSAGLAHRFNIFQIAGNRPRPARSQGARLCQIRIASKETNRPTVLQQPPRHGAALQAGRPAYQNLGSSLFHAGRPCVTSCARAFICHLRPPRRSEWQPASQVPSPSYRVRSQSRRTTIRRRPSLARHKSGSPSMRLAAKSRLHRSS